MNWLRQQQREHNTAEEDPNTATETAGCIPIDNSDDDGADS